MHVGEAINKLRKEKRMTLLDLCRKSGVALATLSRIENGKMTGTLKSHMRIAEALGITIIDLYKDLPESKKTLEVKTKEPEQKVTVHDKKSSTVMLVSSLQNKKMLPLFITIAKLARTNTDQTPTDVDKFIYVLMGKIEANIGEEKYVLSYGDTIYFDSSAPHYFKNIGNGEAQLISVSSPATA
jgi:transcriptional regulator with XRE-family HTH domain